MVEQSPSLKAIHINSRSVLIVCINHCCTLRVLKYLSCNVNFQNVWVSLTQLDSNFTVLRTYHHSCSLLSYNYKLLLSSPIIQCQRAGVWKIFLHGHCFSSILWRNMPCCGLMRQAPTPLLQYIDIFTSWSSFFRFDRIQDLLTFWGTVL